MESGGVLYLCVYIRKDASTYPQRNEHLPNLRYMYLRVRRVQNLTNKLELCLLLAPPA